MLANLHSACFLAVVAAVLAQTDVRLSGGSENSGAVEVRFGEQWGKVCADSFSPFDADVVCRQLTNTGVARLENGKFTTANPFLIADLHCIGTEASILDCHYDESSSCPSGQAAGVFCGEGVTGTLGADIGIIAGIAVTLVALLGVGALTVACLYRNNCCRGPTLA